MKKLIDWLLSFFNKKKFNWDSQNYGEPKIEEDEFNKLNGDR